MSSNVIPLHERDKQDRGGAIFASNLSGNQKIVALALNFKRISAADSWASARDLSSICKLSERAARRQCEELVLTGWAEKAFSGLTPLEIKAKVISSKNSQFGSLPNSKECEWCGYNTLVLHEHHFPVRHSDGGTETVSICPNCHAEYHAIENCSAYRLSEGLT